MTHVLLKALTLVAALALCSPALSETADPTKSEEYLRIMPQYDGDEEPWENTTYQKYTTCDRPEVPEFFNNIPRFGPGEAITLNLYFSYLQTLERKNCNCDAKVMSFDRAIKEYKDLRKNTPAQYRVSVHSYFEENQKLSAKIKRLCGGKPF